MKQISRVNYLHYGDAFQRLSRADLSSFDGATKHELIWSIEDSNSSSRYLRGLLADYASSRSRCIDITALQSDLRCTAQMRQLFRTLGCRGFSYNFFTEMTGFPYRLRRQINLRMALVADRALFYPPNVKKYLARHTANHYFVYQAPAIAFALGTTTRKCWYVFVMQSDLIRRGPASVREHFRGWRKVLFFNIVNAAKESADRICLCHEEDVLEACHADYPRPYLPPASWRNIYRRTATDFGMVTTGLSRRINIQLYDRKAPVYAKSVYVLDLKGKTTGLHRFSNGDTL